MSLVLLTLFACGPSNEAIITGISSPNPAVREDMVKVARANGSDEIIEALIGALEDPSPDIRREALDSLAKLKAVEAVPSIIPHLTDSDDRVQRAAVDALGRLEDERGAQPLVEYLEAREGLRIPLNAIWALGNIGDNAGLGVLSQLRDHADPYVVYNACWSLRQLRASEG